MFEDLNAVPWATLQQAYGSAEEVPVWLRRLISPRRSVRELALYKLWITIWHQGSVYSATGPAVPFLLEILDAPEPHDAAGILELLGDIASAHSWWDNNLSDNSPFFVEERATAEFQQKMLDDRAAASRAREAVRAGLAQFTRLLGDEQMVIQMEAAQILASFREDEPAMRALLLDAYAQEHDPVVQGFFLYLLRTLPAEWEAGPTFFTDTFAQAQADIVRLCAAQALLEWQHDDVDDSVLRFVIEALCMPSENLTWQWRQFPRTGNITLLSRWLYVVNTERLESYVPLLITRMRDVGEYQASDFATLLLTIAFHGYPTAKLPAIAAKTQLTPLQITVISALVKTNLPWHDFDLQRLLEYLGLPIEHKSLAALVDITIASEPPSSDIPPPELTPTSGLQQMVFTADPQSLSGSENWLSHYSEVFHATFPERDCSPFGGDMTDIPEEENPSYQRLTAGGKSVTILRFPLTAAGLDDARYQVGILRVLRERLPVAIPDPRYSHLETNVLGDAFWGYASLPGKPLSPEMLVSVPDDATRRRLIATLKLCLSTLYHLTPDDFPIPLRDYPLNTALDDLAERAQALPLAAHTLTAIATHIKEFAATYTQVTFSPVVIHGALYADNILYDARSQRLSGIVHWDAVSLGDPALDLGALASQYDPTLITQLQTIVPASPSLMTRMQFFAGMHTLKRMLTLAARIKDEASSSSNANNAAHRVELLHEDLAYEQSQLAHWWVNIR